MAQVRYRIFTMSAAALMAYAQEGAEGYYTFALNVKATEKCKVQASLHEQQDCALFFQAMCVLHEDSYQMPTEDTLVSDLSDVICYVDFSNIFDRNAAQNRHAIRQKKAESMFRPEGITLDFGAGPHRYVAFERSNSMSRKSQLSFVREDFYEPLRQGIMLDMEIGPCQLSKLYAYNGLMLSGGTRIDGIEIDRPHRVIVIDNEEAVVQSVPVITVEDDGSIGNVRKYHRVERKEKITVTCFDGEGLISKEYAREVDKAYCGRHIHTSFQIRLPYVKGMLHQVDFKDFLTSGGCQTITDIWGVEHNVRDVNIILTKSMFKGFGWLTENNMTWNDYWKAFRKRRHALYITQTSKEKPERFTTLNYQFLNTVSMTADEFRPNDLPLWWDDSPANDKRHWLTKEAELTYYSYCSDDDFRKQYFLSALERRWFSKKSKAYYMARVLKKNSLFINEPVYTKELDSKAEKVLNQYAIGQLIVAGDNRFLSGDLLELLTSLLPKRTPKDKAKRTFLAVAIGNQFANNSFYAPKAAYEHGRECTLLRNPHIARNEEIQLNCYTDVEQMRKHYLGHLTDVVMVDSHTLTAERLGGADFDGDMIKTISDPILNTCVKRNYQDYSSDITRQTNGNIPLLKIPTVEPQIRDANDWYARFETVRNTFSSRVGQISNAALDRSVIAYNENSDSELQQRCREETEILAILTGLEIDSAKSGVKPDLSEYLNKKVVNRSLFLQYKKLLESAEVRGKWYEPTFREKRKEFFEKTDWSKVDSNLERLPYLAYQLRRNTPKLKPKPAKDSELFDFAREPGWTEKLDPHILSSVSAFLSDYEACLSRIRACRVPVQNKQRKNDIERILFSRGQEDTYDSDELYAAFQDISAERIAEIRAVIADSKWHFMDGESRFDFLESYLPELENYHELFADFRYGGYRILGDLICDIDDENRSTDRKKYLRNTDSDSFHQMMNAYLEQPLRHDYREIVADKCREILDIIEKPRLAVRYVVALGKRDLLWDLLIDHIEENVLKEESHAE
ncbi:RNA dependent RNA polymerase [Acutalibacter muris]|uniref:RNA dependent RNA polymerase n=1 Tax=Acutalibacter muris TaxID=1796620 RepID=UPI000B17E93B|nr:RNA dependent RNA polymerase [Acutalibacter muris]